MPAVSVIVPVYNTEKYLEECIRSLTEQTLFSLELTVPRMLLPRLWKDIVPGIPNTSGSSPRRTQGRERQEM